MTTATLSPVTDKEAWLQARLETIGASEAGSVLGVSDAYETPLQVWGRKVGKIPLQSETTEAMEWGLRLESALADAYQEKSGKKIVAQQVYCRAGFLSATLDAIDDEGGLVELKTISERCAAQVLGDEGTSDVPMTWILQAHQQMFVHKLAHDETVDRVTFACLIGGNQYRTYEVAWNERLWNNALPRLNDFWTDHVVLRVPPPIVGSADVATLGKIFGEAHGTVYLPDEIAQAAYEWDELGRQISDLNKVRDLAKARVLEAMESYSVGVLPDGRKLKRSICVTKEHTVKGSQYVRLSLSKG
jgi:putative phage-type endonuclease